MIVRRLAISLIVCGAVSLSQLQAQESEIVMPATQTKVGIGEINEAGNLELQLAARGQRVPVTEMVQQNYTVQVPYTVQEEKDGKKVNVTKMRTETRTRDVAVTRMVTVNHADYAFDKLKFYRIDGQEVSIKDARDHFASKQPIVIIQNGGEINDYFDLVFREDVMIVEEPAQQEQVRAAPLRRPAARRSRVRSSEKEDDK